MEPRQSTAEVVAGSLPDHRRIIRKKVRNRVDLMTASCLDGRSVAGRRARQVSAELIAGFGAGITSVQRQACDRAGMLVALAEDLGVRALAGLASVDEALRAEGVARRAVRAVLAERSPEARGGPLPLFGVER